MAWLYFEVLCFYLNIIAMAVFLLINSCKKFVSLKDRYGLSITQRNQTDFLSYCKDDIHWFSLWFTQLLLSVLALHMRTEDY